MIRKLALFGLVGLGLAACQTGITTTNSSYAVDTNGDGIIDCQDLDRVHMCLHYVDAETDELCGKADVSNDGVIDDEDIHGMFNGMSERGYHCAEPPVHDTCGTDCDTSQWEAVLGQHQENEYEHEYENEAGCEEGDCPGEQNRFRKRCRCRYRGCEGDDCPDCPADCGCGDGDGDGDDPGADDPGSDDPGSGDDADPPEGEDDIPYVP